MNVLNTNSSSKHDDVLLAHLDYRYIDKCQNTREMEKILKVLRSGKEGHYPDLEAHAEKKLESLNPESKVLRKSQPVSTPGDVDKDEWEFLSNDIKDWSSDMKNQEDHIKQPADGASDLPPVRGSKQEIPIHTKSPSETTKKQKSKKRVKPREYDEWEKVDIEAELEKIDDKSSTEKGGVKNVLKKPAIPQIPVTVDTSGLTQQEKQQKAEREKNKGNEAFQAGDLDEALLYYNRSLSVMSSVPAHNNRAQTYIKLKKWESALLDCNLVLSMDAKNIKALLRRAVALQGQRKYVLAKQDLERVLDMEPPNKRAKDLLKEVEAAIAEQKVKGRRMLIEEYSGTDSESEPRTSESEDEEQDVGQVNGNIGQVNGNIGQVNGNVNEEERIKLTSKSEKKIPEAKVKIESESKSKPAAVEKEDAKTSQSTDSDEGEDFVDGPCFSKGHTTTTQNSEPAADNAAVTDKDSGFESHDLAATPQGQIAARTPASQLAVQPSMTAPPVSDTLPLPRVVEAHKQDGNLLFKSGQYADAISQYTTAIHLLQKEKDPAQDGNLSLLYTNRATCCSKIGDCIGCIDDCTLALELTPGALKPLLRRALAYETSEKYRQAYVGFRQVLRVDPNADVAQQGSTRCTRMLQLEYGASWRDKLPEVPNFPIPPNVSSHTVSPTPVMPTPAPTKPQGQTQSQGQPKVTTPKVTPKVIPEVSPKARAEFDKLKTLGNSLVQKGEFKVAADCYGRCIAVIAHEVAPYTNRALCYLKLEQPDKVVSDCEKALELQPNNPKALFRKAQAYKMQCKYQESLRDLETLLHLDSKNAAAKKEMELVQELAQKQEATKSSQKPERQRMKIQEVDESSEDEEEDAGKNKQNSHKASTKQQQQHPQQKGNSGSFKKSKQDGSQRGQPPKQSPEGARSAKANSPSAPRLQKGSGYEFVQAWTSLKSCEDVEPFVDLLTQVPPKQLPSVISNKLEGPMLVDMVRCVKCLVNRGQVQEASQYLQSLAKVDRFGMVSMFMSKVEKQDVSEVFEALQSHSDVTLSPAEMADLKNKYGLL